MLIPSRYAAAATLPATRTRATGGLGSERADSQLDLRWDDGRSQCNVFHSRTSPDEYLTGGARHDDCVNNTGNFFFFFF